MATAMQALKPTVESKPTDILVGKYFLTFIGDTLRNRGKIINRASGFYLVQHFNREGGPTDQKLFSITVMKLWKFYDSREAWENAAKLYKVCE